MSEPFLAEMRIVGFNFAPRGWALCDGQILPINQNQSLYSLLGTTYGGDGRTSFALPDMRGRAPMHVGDNGLAAYHALGQKSGEETHTLAANEMPAHNHNGTLNVTANLGVETILTGQVIAQDSTGSILYKDSTANLKNMNSGSLSNVGGGQAHDNMQPWLALNFVIALQGLFPSRD